MSITLHDNDTECNHIAPFPHLVVLTQNPVIRFHQQKMHPKREFILCATCRHRVGPFPECTCRAGCHTLPEPFRTSTRVIQSS